MPKITPEIADDFKSLIKEELRSIKFVADYFVLNFENTKLQIYTDAYIDSGNQIKFDQPKFAEILNSQLGNKPSKIDCTEEKITIKFLTDNSLIIPIKDTDYKGSEALYFKNLANKWFVI